MGAPLEYQPAIITNWMKILMTFIDRVGFPVLAFLLMFWLSHTTMERMKEAIDRQTDLIQRINEKLERVR